MGKGELSRLLNRLMTARDAANWEGKFTSEIRHATVDYRMHNIAKPLDEAIAVLKKRLDKAVKPRNHKRVALPQRLPYKDD